MIKSHLMNGSGIEAETHNFDSPVELLLIDDDVKFCRLICEYLERYGYDVTLVHDGRKALQVFPEKSWDAVILDVMLPGLDGFAVLTKIREQCDVPVLMLTALGDETDRIVGLEVGADDYLPKTFSPRELLARLRAVLRRTQNKFSPTRMQSANDTCKIISGDLTIDLDSRSTTLDGNEIALTPVEFDILATLAQSAGRVKSREQLLNDIRDRNYDAFDRSIDVHVSALRRKLKDNTKSPKFIKTVRSAGYLFVGATK